MSAIFYHTKDQGRMAEESLKVSQQSYKKPIITLILPAGHFYDAEE